MPSTHRVSLQPGRGYPEGLSGSTRLRLLAYFQDLLDELEPTSLERIGELFRDPAKRDQAALLMQAAGALTVETYAHLGRAHGPVSAAAMSEMVGQAAPRFPTVDLDEMAHSLARISRSPDGDPALRLAGAAHEALPALGLLTSQAALAAAAAHPHAPTLKDNATGAPPAVVRLARDLIAELDQALADGPPVPPVLVTSPGPDDEGGGDPADVGDAAEAGDAGQRALADFTRNAVFASGFVLLPLTPDPYSASSVGWSESGVPAFVFRSEDEPDIGELLAVLRGRQAEAESSATWQLLGTAEDYLVRLELRWTAPLHTRLNLIVPVARLAAPAREALAASDVVAVVPWPGGSPPPETSGEAYAENALIVRVERFREPEA